MFMNRLCGVVRLSVLYEIRKLLLYKKKCVDVGWSLGLSSVLNYVYKLVTCHETLWSTPSCVFSLVLISGTVLCDCVMNDSFELFGILEFLGD